MKSLLRNKRALSPVIATVILVSVTIVVAVSVAYWMGTISSSFTSFEQIEMPTAYPEFDDNITGVDLAGWNVTVTLKNTGSADATITDVYLNDKPVNKYFNGTFRFVNVTDETGQKIRFDLEQSIPVPKGTSVDIVITIMDGTEGVSHGTRIDLKFHSAAGQDYPRLVKLP